MYGRETFAGLDLGWTTGCTGLALLDDTGALLASTRLQTDDEIVAWIHAQPGSVVVAAVDAPLIVPNETGQRVPEHLIGKAFGAFGASAHTTNRAKFGGARPRAAVLADRLGWETDPDTGPATPSKPLCIEVYPHPAMVSLFTLDYRLDYKKGDRSRRSAGLRVLMRHLETISTLQLAANARWREMAAAVENATAGQLDRIEDELDAVVCAHLAWLWHHHRAELTVYGSARDGYIVAPPPPAHTPVRPVAIAPTATSLTRTISGRPTGYAAGDHERAWKAAVRAAFGDVQPLPAGRVAVEMVFVLRPLQVGRNEPDLDNLIKATIDALECVLGTRPGTGSRVEADDVRVDRIVASKRFGAVDEAGAEITVRLLP